MSSPLSHSVLRHAFKEHLRSESPVSISTTTSKYLNMATYGECDRASRPRAHLLTLPQEILDVIFGLAYVSPRNSKLLKCEDWRKREWSARRRSSQHNVRPCPDVKANHFMVSKQYFVSACKAYVSSRALHETFDADSVLGRDVAGVFISFVTKVRTDVDSLDSISVLSSLKAVCVELEGHDFEAAAPKMAWEDELVEEDFARLQANRQLSKIRGLLRLNFVLASDVDIHYHRKQEKSILLANIKRFEALLRPIVIRPREDVQSPAEYARSPVPLYKDSAVCFGTSQLHSPYPGVKIGTAETQTSLVSARLSFESNARMARYRSLIAPDPENSKKRIRNSDIPEDLSSFQAFLAENGEDAMQWIRAKKRGRTVGY